MMAGLSDSSRFLPLTKSAYHHEKGLAHALRFDRTFTDLYYRSAGWSSLVARWAHNPKVGGSNPPPATNSTASIANTSLQNTLQRNGSRSPIWCAIAPDFATNLLPTSWAGSSPNTPFPHDRSVLLSTRGTHENRR